MDIEFRSLLESIGITDIDDVTITSAAQYDHLELNGSNEWVNVSDLTIGNSALVVDITTLVVNASGYTDKVGVGTATPAVLFEALSATTPQLRLTHTDGVDYLDIGVDASGNVDIDWSGTQLCFNELGNDRDFRIETLNEAQFFRINGGNEIVEIKKGSPSFSPETGEDLVTVAQRKTTAIRSFIAVAEANNTLATANRFQGLNAFARHYGTGNLTDASRGLTGGRYIATKDADTSVITAARAVTAQVFNANNITTGSITNAYDYYAEGVDAEDATIDNAYSFYGEAHLKDTGTLTNAYGIYLKTQTAGATDNYSIVLEDDGKIALGTGKDVLIDYDSATAALEIDLTGVANTDFNIRTTKLTKNFTIDGATGHYSFFGGTGANVKVGMDARELGNITEDSMDILNIKAKFKPSNTVAHGYNVLSSVITLKDSTAYAANSTFNALSFALAVEESGGVAVGSSNLDVNLIDISNTLYGADTTFGDFSGLKHSHTQSNVFGNPTITATNWYTIYSKAPTLTDGTMTITTRYGARYEDYLNATITDQYGIWIDEMTAGTNDYELWIDGSGEIFFRDNAIHIGSLTDGHLDFTADTSFDFNTGSVDIVGDAQKLRIGATPGSDYDIEFDGTDLVLNEANRTVGFRIETADSTTSFDMDASNGNIGIGAAISAQRRVNLDFTVDDDVNAGNAGIYVTAKNTGNKGLEGIAAYATAAPDTDSNRSYRGMTNQVIYDPTHSSGTLTMSNVIPLIGLHGSVRFQGASGLTSDFTAPIVGVNAQISIQDACTQTITFTETANFLSQGITGEAYSADLTTTNHKHISIKNANPIAGWTITNLYGMYIVEQTGGGTVNNEIFLDGGGGIFFRDTDTEISSDATDKIQVITGGQEVAEFGTTGNEIVFNDGQVDLDFRIEGSGQANLLFVDAGNNRIGVNTNLPAQSFHIVGSNVNIMMEDTGGSGTAGFRMKMGAPREWFTRVNATEGYEITDESAGRRKLLILKGSGATTIELGDAADTGDVKLIFQGTTAGDFYWDRSLAQFVFSDKIYSKGTITMETNQSINFRTSDTYINSGSLNNLSFRTLGNFWFYDGNLYLDADNQSIDFGVAQDAKIYYDGTDLIIDPDVVGSGGIKIEASSIITDTTTGLKIGTATTQKLGFFNTTPVVQATGIVDADGTLADITTKFNSLLAKMEAYGLLAIA